MRPSRNFAVVGVLALTAAIAWAEGSSTVSDRTSAPDAPGDISTNPVGVNIDYKIDTGDLLRISVKGEPQLSKSVFVDRSGTVVLPLVNTLPLAGLTVSEAQALVQGSFQKYLKHPETTVVIQQVNRFLIYITGNVVRAGGYPLTKGLDVTAIIHEAGGLTRSAKAGRIYLLQRSTGKVKRKVDYNAVSRGRKRQEDFLLATGDTVVVP